MRSSPLPARPISPPVTTEELLFGPPDKSRVSSTDAAAETVATSGLTNPRTKVPSIRPKQFKQPASHPVPKRSGAFSRRLSQNENCPSPQDGAAQVGPSAAAGNQQADPRPRSTSRGRRSPPYHAFGRTVDQPFLPETAAGPGLQPAAASKRKKSAERPALAFGRAALPVSIRLNAHNAAGGGAAAGPRPVSEAAAASASRQPGGHPGRVSWGEVENPDRDREAWSWYPLPQPLGSTYSHLERQERCTTLPHQPHEGSALILPLKSQYSKPSSERPPLSVLQAPVVDKSSKIKWSDAPLMKFRPAAAEASDQRPSAKQAGSSRPASAPMSLKPPSHAAVDVGHQPSAAATRPIQLALPTPAAKHNHRYPEQLNQSPDAGETPSPIHRLKSLAQTSRRIQI